MLELSPWTLHLDEEGYPVMDNGIRGDDDEFLKLVFQNLKRYQGNDKFPLCTEMDGKEIIVTSFDDPLVAREVTIIGSEFEWRFLGGLKLKSPMSDLRVDEWDRLHAYVGPEKIPAVMSRKAQSAFLQAHPDLKSLKPKPFRQSSGFGTEKDWNSSYVEKDTPWDMDKPNPAITEEITKMLELSGKNWLYPGAGGAHEVPFLEEKGKTLSVIDVSEKAKENFHKRYLNSKCHYKVGDFFQETQKYDAILESLFFIAIPPEWRIKAVRKIHELLNPGGFWGGNFYTRFAEGGPPYGLSEWELKRHTQELFDIIEWRRGPHSHPKRKHTELWVLLRKKI